MLKLDTVNAYYGDVQVLFDVSLEINEGEIVTILGSNGAGKTSVIKTICNMLPIRSGAIYYGDKRLDKLPSHKLVSMEFLWSRKDGICFHTCPCTTISCWAHIA